MTCGEKACQRARHAKRCRLWRQANAAAAAHHYWDFVVSFRQRYPDYQRSWRWLRRLREIRETIEGSLVDLIPRLERLVERGRDLAGDTNGQVVQLPKMTTEVAGWSSSVAQSIVKALDQIQGLLGQLAGASGKP